MAVFRIEKTRDYTVMANHHLRNTVLSLKAKGLLSLMLRCRRIGIIRREALPVYAGTELTVYAPP